MSLTATIEKNRPSGCKGKLWNTATLSSTMGPAIKLDLRKTMGLEIARWNARNRIRGAECVRTGRMPGAWELDQVSRVPGDGARMRAALEKRATSGYPARPRGWGQGNSLWGGR